MPLSGDTNCAIFATQLLAKSGVAKFPPLSFCSTSATSQAVYTANEAYKSGSVSAIYLKSGSKEAMEGRKI